MTNKILSYSGNRSLKNLFFHFITGKRAAFHRAFRLQVPSSPAPQKMTGMYVVTQHQLGCVCSSTGQIKYSPGASSAHWTLHRK